ncbi:MAG: C39 family peptidase [Clostridia bacterium]|nr:C39 family peptidase [Clostridia bacterium]
MKHRLLSALLCAGLLVALAPGVFAENGPPGDVLQDNFFRVTSAEGWRQGELDRLIVLDEVGDGALCLAPGETDGAYRSPEMTVPAFEYLVASWSADTPEGSWVEIRARAYVDQKEQWSDWLSWGKSGIRLARGSLDRSDGLAKMDTDTFIVLGSSGETASRVQVEAVLHSDAPDASPCLRSLSGTMKNTLAGQDIPVYQPHAGEPLPEKVLLAAPAYSQITRDPAIGNSICSPTSLCVMLGQRGLELFPEEVALQEYDFSYGFGNWPFTVAYAGAFGFDGYCHYADLDFVRQELAHGRSVALSVRYSSTPNGANPYLENGAISNTSGHLIAIVGYETIDGVEYFYSNDSAAGDDVSCALRRYRADQLDAAWSGRIVYVVSASPEQGAGLAAPQRIEAALEPADAAGTYRLTAGGAPVELSRFFSMKTESLGAGTAFWIEDSASAPAMPDPVPVTAANLPREYLSVSAGLVSLTGAQQQALAEKSGTVWIIQNDGVTYAATLTVEPYTPPAETDPAADPASPTTQPGTDTFPTVYVVIAGAALLLAIILLLKKKR